MRGRGLDVSRVLIGVDGSELAREAARQALDVLGTAHEITLVEVVRPITPIAAVPTGAIAGEAVIGDQVEATEESNRARAAEAETHLAATARELGVEATTRVVMGDPGTELCRLAADADVDLLVVGSHGSGFLKRVLLGSVSHHVLHHAPCPVLVVRGSVSPS